jgi:ABC-2 type transport system ATP-binding protein
MSADAGEFAISTTSLRKQFGSFTAVDGIDLRVKKGEIFGFIGPNGSGKSTTIKMLLGLISPTSGDGSVLGYDIKRDTERIRQSVGYMAQKFSLYDDLTAMENARFYSNIYGLMKDEARVHIRRTFDQLGLMGVDDVRAGELATGWRQRLALACALVHSPSLLFLDEPTGGVDPVARREFWNILYGLADEGVTVFVTTHYMDEADYCHHLGLINEGRIAADGTPASIKEDAGAASLDSIFARVVRTGGVHS